MTSHHQEKPGNFSPLEHGALELLRRYEAGIFAGKRPIVSTLEHPDTMVAEEDKPKSYQLHVRIPNIESPNGQDAAYEVEQALRILLGRDAGKLNIGVCGNLKTVRVSPKLQDSANPDTAGLIHDLAITLANHGINFPGSSGLQAAGRA